MEGWLISPPPLGVRGLDGDAPQSNGLFLGRRYGNLLTVTDAKKQTITYTYDAKNRLKTRTEALNRCATEIYPAATTTFI